MLQVYSNMYYAIQYIYIYTSYTTISKVKNDRMNDIPQRDINVGTLCTYLVLAWSSII